MAMLTETQSAKIGFLDRFAAIAAAIGDLRRARATVRDLGTLDDHMLRDIGLSRSDLIEIERASPASDRIELLRRARMRNIG